MKPTIQVLIIEDDFRVANINQELVNQIEGFHAEAIAKTGDEAIAFLEQAEPLPDLVLLDVFIPDRSGLNLFWEIRSAYRGVDIIMLSAATDAKTIEETVRGGISDYLIKPVDFVRFQESLLRYKDQKTFFSSKVDLEQSDIDRLIGRQHIGVIKEDMHQGDLPKGIDALTLSDVLEVLNTSPAPGVNAMETGQAVGVSRSTARRYLEHLVSTGDAKAQLNYGEIGRPERRYIPWTE
ncbi:Transcriptional regulatory protein CitT [Planococcus massiliensis]|uniref:Transcriptional regulatory protein n=1 Tax=Planococcus massiliensis TaxID=1499687 RepID=A0A098EM33_9BACL|nr:response regulator [Planococcus massiliensis]CEG22867.1 Transcriptional regulatory protein CitT [Planococcus massiliensis]